MSCISLDTALSMSLGSVCCVGFFCVGEAAVQWKFQVPGPLYGAVLSHCAVDHVPSIGRLELDMGSGVRSGFDVDDSVRRAVVAAVAVTVLKTSVATRCLGVAVAADAVMRGGGRCYLYQFRMLNMWYWYYDMMFLLFCIVDDRA